VVARLMSGRGADRYVLVGHSMGGKIASALAARQPRGLEALVLVAPSPLSPEPMEEADRDHLLASHGQPGAAEALLRKITRRPLGADAWIRAVDDNTTTSQAAWRWWLERGGPEDLAPLASSVRVRTLIVAAADDPVLPLHGHQALADRLAGPTRLSTVPDCGHLLPLEAPGETAALIAGFIQAASSPPGEAVTPQGDLHVL
jgi:pimeloyl-ACP methyl ester carboxylesterase